MLGLGGGAEIGGIDNRGVSRIAVRFEPMRVVERQGVRAAHEFVGRHLFVPPLPQEQGHGKDGAPGQFRAPWVGEACEQLGNLPLERNIVVCNLRRVAVIIASRALVKACGAPTALLRIPAGLRRAAIFAAA